MNSEIPPPAPSAPRARLVSAAAFLLPAALAILAFLPALGNKFIFDDLGEMGSFDGLFAPGTWPGLFLRAQHQLYRPIKYITLHFDHALYGWNPGNPWGFHLTNLLLHAGACVALQFFLRRLGASRAAAALASAWFALHPVHAEAVVWVTARGSMLSAIGVFAAAAFYLRWRERGRPLDLAALGFFALFAYFSKEDSIMLVAALPLLELWGRVPAREEETRPAAQAAAAMALCAALAILYVALRQSLLDEVRQGRWEHGLRGLLSTLPGIILRYLGQLLYPVTLVLEPPIDFTAGFGLRFWLPLAALLPLPFLFFVRGARLRPIKLALGWFFLFLFPTLGFIPINAPAADRFLYIPSAAGAILLAAGWDAAGRAWPERRRLLAALLGVLLILYIISDVAYARVWRDDPTLWSYVVKVNPRSYRGWNNLAAEANKRGEHPQALEWAGRSLAIKPDYIEAILTLARSLDHLRRSQEAEAAYRRVIEMNGQNTIALNLYADFLDRARRPEEAERVYDRIFQIRPGFVEARINAGVVAISLGKLDRAIAHWEAALQHEPGNEMAHKNIARAKAEKTTKAQ